MARELRSSGGGAGKAYSFTWLGRLHSRQLETLDKNRLTVSRAREIQRFLSQPFHVAEVFTDSPGKYVGLKDSIRGFKAVIAGEYDHLPEQAFYTTLDTLPAFPPLP